MVLPQLAKLVFHAVSAKRNLKLFLRLQNATNLNLLNIENVTAEILNILALILSYISVLYQIISLALVGSVNNMSIFSDFAVHKYQHQQE